MGIKVKIADFDSRNKKISAAVRQSLGDASGNLKLGIIKRSKSGQSVSGTAFKAYSPAYKAYKEARERDVSTVDLTFSNMMWKALQISEPFQQAAAWVIEITCNIDYARRVNAVREFFGLDKKQTTYLKNKIKQDIRKNGL